MATFVRTLTRRDSEYFLSFFLFFLNTSFGILESMEINVPDNIWLDASEPLLGETRLSWRNSTSSVMSIFPRGKLLLEVLMVLMCVGAVTGAVVYFCSLSFFFPLHNYLK